MINFLTYLRGKANMLEQSAKFIGAGLATISLAGSGVGIGIVFAAYQFDGAKSIIS